MAPHLTATEARVLARRIHQGDQGAKSDLVAPKIINAVVADGTAAMAEDLAPVLTNPQPPALPELVGQVLRAVAGFGRHKKGGIDRLLVSLHGWSHSHSDPRLKAATRVSYSGRRKLFADAVRRWQAAGTFDAAVDPGAVAELLTSITLGFVAQRALAGGADVGAHVDALEALTHRSRTEYVSPGVTT